MEELKLLLDNYMIIKERDRDLYYEIKDKLKYFKTFTQDKLGYDIVVHPDFIKLEKFPGRVEEWMGIEDFQEVRDYCFLMLLLMFLEDKAKEEQFILSMLLEYISVNHEGEKIDWTVYSNRRALVRVLRFAIRTGIVKVNDGEEESFANNASAEVLYENTGISKYIVRNFPLDIEKAESYKDFVNFAWEDMNEDKGALRRNRVYRNLVMTPAVHNEGSEDQDYYYIKNFKGILEADLEKYLSYKLHVHKEVAMVVLADNERCKEHFPDTSAISDIVLLFSKRLLEEIKEGKLSIKDNFKIELTLENFEELLESLRAEKSAGFSKEFREGSFEHLKAQLIAYMKSFNMLEETKDRVFINPLAAKLIGDYPKEFTDKEQKQGE